MLFRSRLAAGTRIGPGLEDDALIALSIENAWSLNSSACACASCAKDWRAPIATVMSASKQMAAAIRPVTDRLRAIRAMLLCAIKSITPLDLWGYGVSR